MVEYQLVTFNIKINWIIINYNAAVTSRKVTIIELAVTFYENYACYGLSYVSIDAVYISIISRCLYYYITKFVHSVYVCTYVRTYIHIYSSTLLLTISPISPLAPLDSRNCITLECP